MPVKFLLLGAVSAAILCAADTAPDWVMEQSTRAVPQYPAQVSTVTLLDEGHLIVEPNGMGHRELRYAIRVLNEEGRKNAVASVPYFRKLTRIHELKAWLVTPNGVKAYGKDAVMDVSLQEKYELYDDQRAHMIIAHNAPVGSTFAWEASIDEPPLIADDLWSFQERNPVLLSRYIISLPPGWEAKAAVFNATAPQPVVQGNTYTWELRDLPFIKHEWGAPARLGPWMGVSYYPLQGSAPVAMARTWSDVSAYQCKLADSQVDASDAMSAKVRELTAGAPTPYARIQAIAHYVQQIKYVAIETNQARGGGYQPHPASQVFARNYGDCKDKANLMRAMLKLAGIDSYLVAIYSGDPYSVHPEWPSPEQFNHMIIAVKAPDDVKGPAVLEHPQLGRLLIFDPTSESTPTGDIPDYEQGSYALVLAGARGDLVKIPAAPPETDRTDVNVNGTLAETGALDATIALSSQGQSAAHLRDMYAQIDPKQVNELLERWVAATAKQSSLKNVQASDTFEQGRFALSLDVSAPSYAQIMQQRIMLFKPSVISRFGGFEGQAEKRETPVVLEPVCYHASVHVKLPPGFKVDEMPDPANFQTKYGKFTSTYKLDGSDFVFTEDLDVSAVIIPPEEYDQLKRFFQHVYGAEQAPLLLMRN